MYGLHGEAACGCKAGAILWIEAWFGDCVYSYWELTSFYLGLLSLLLWLVAQVPQLISNWRLQSAEALSPWFLFQWLAGDSFNFIGCLLTGDQLATQNLSAGYFMLSDFVVISQYMYYQQPRYQEKELLHSNDEDGKKSIAGSSEVVCTPAVSSSETCNFKDIENAGDQRLKGLQRHLAQCPCGEAVPLLLNQAHDLKSSKRENFKALPSHTPSSPSTNKHLRRVVMQYGLEYGPPTGSLLRMHHGPLRKHGKYVRRAAAVVVNLVGLVCLGATAFGSGSRNQPAIKSEGWAVGRKLLVICNHPRTLWMRNSGTLIGWASASLYLGSRISQVVKNADRGSAEGLSLGMVLCAISANLAYGVSVFMRLSSWQEFVAKAPWIVGSLGTVSLDIILLLQSRYLTCYAQSRKDKLSEHTPLLA
uniref:PQ-loop repeat family protein / transmembrane family protein n=1 Tax=Physcomitrium patens TaxID=3218 RepID=A0A7I4CNU2_PHYPA